MGAHHALGHFEKNRRVALPSLRPGYGFNIDHVGDEVCFDHAVAVELAAATEVTLFAFEPVRESVRIINYEIFAMKQIENQRRSRHCEQPCRFISLAVEGLVPSVERDREQTPGLPFETLLRAVGLPHRGRAPAIKNIDQRLEYMPLRVETLAGRNTTHVSIVKVSRAVQHDIDAVPP